MSIDADPLAVAADLVAALGGERSGAMAVDGAVVGPEVPVAELGLRCGSVIEIGPRRADAATVGRLGVFNRPPRLLEPRRTIEIATPVRAPEPGAPVRFGWATLVVPVLLGLGMAMLIHPRMAAFALFSPAMLLANWLEDRRRLRRARGESNREYSAGLHRLREQLAAAHREETEHRRRAHCPPPGLIAHCGGSLLWERRRNHADFMRLAVGSGCVGWDVPVSDPDGGAIDVVAEYETLHNVPIAVDLRAGSIVGVAGTRDHALAIVRQMVLQAVVSHGPADLAVTISTERAADWDWAKWLPHLLIDTAGRRRIATDSVEIAAVVAQLEAEVDEGRLHLLVVDLPDLALPERAPIRRAMQSGAVAAIALATRTTELPSLSTTVILAQDQHSHIRHADGSVDVFTPWTASCGTARRAARILARVDDPEAATAGAGLPAAVALVGVLGLEPDPADSIRARWRAPGRTATAIGIAADGELTLDLVADGPHALLAGTTGAGKSELLRSLVAGLAVNVSPTALNLVLVDYKGGSAFDACADLPHTVGVVTDLDDHLASRALICLEAELRRREQLLRSHGASDIAELGSVGILPRLLVVVDEFAALAKELPQFMDALVGAAQRGRSLGVHLLLATQRPAGVVGDNIKANTNLRIALRVQDASESVDVIGRPTAASIPRSLPGRGLARRGPGDVVEFQVAHVSGHDLGRKEAQVVVQPFVFAHEQPLPAPTAEPASTGPSDLDRIVAACKQVARELSLAKPRSPWPDPLPERAVRGPAPEQRSVFALADEPYRQRVVSVEWDPAMGSMLFYGLPGSGTTTAVASLAMALATGHKPGRLHMYVLDCDDQQLLPLQRLPHVGAAIAGGERERQLRLLRTLGAEVERRRASRRQRPGTADDLPAIVTMIDNFADFADSFAEPGDMGVHDLVARLMADGPGVGMFTVATAKQPADIPTRVAATVATRYVFQLADRYDYTGLGLPAIEPPSNAGRAFEAGSARELQILLPHEDGLEAAIRSLPAQRADPAPWCITALPSEVPLAEFVTAGSIAQDEWFLPLGIGDSNRRPAGLLLREGEHALITGPPQSGKTTALVTAAQVARQASPRLRIVAVAPHRSNLCLTPSVDEVITAQELETLETPERGLLLLVDDAELITVEAGLRRLLGERSPRVRVVAAGSSDVIRSLYGHWTQDLRRSRIGCALRPSDVSDGDLWHTQLPRNRHQSFPAGRGYLLARGRAELVQLGHP